MTRRGAGGGTCTVNLKELRRYLASDRLRSRDLPDDEVVRAILSLPPHFANATQLLGSSHTDYDDTNIYWPLIGGATVATSYYENAMMGLRSDGYAGKFDDTAALTFLGILVGGQGVGSAPGYVQVDAADANGANIAVIKRPYRFRMPLSSGTASRLTDIGKPVYAVFDNAVTMDPTATSFANLVGYITDVLTGTFPDTNPTTLTGGYVEIVPAYNFGATPVSAAFQNVRCTTQLDKTSNTTLANIVGMSVNLGAGRKYGFHAKLFTTSTANGGLKVGLGGTATATSIIAEAKAWTTTTPNISAQVTALGAVAGATVATDSAEIWGEIVVNAAGTLTIQAAQNASHADTTSVKVGSWLQLFELSN